MASKEDLSEQLALMQKLAAATERVAEAAEKIDKTYSTQLNTLQQLANALGQLNVQSAVASIDALNKTLKDSETRLNDTGKAGESNFKRLGVWLDKTGTNFKNKFPKSVGIGTAALTGFYQGIQNTIALGKGVTGFVTSFVSGLGSITMSILAIPLKMFEGLIDMAAKAASGSNELWQALEDLRKQFGAFYGPTNKAIITTTMSMKGFSDTGLNSWMIFGNMAQRLEYMNKLVTEMGASFTKLRQEFLDNGGAILAYQKGLGLAGEEMKAVVMRSAAMGKTSEKTLRDMTKYSYELGDAFGLDAKLISRDMGKALGDVAHFGGATVKQIGEAATYARKLGVELDKITGTLDAFDTYDTAAENAAKLSQAMGVQIDAFEMMQAQSPAEQLDMLRKSFARAGVDASTFNRAQLKLVSSTTGLDEATVQSALSMKNQGASLEQIKKKGGEAEKKTITQAEAMKKLADAIERMTFAGGGLHGGFWSMFVAGIKNGIMGTKEFYGVMIRIQYALRQVYMIGVQLGRALVEIVPGIKDIGKGFNEIFNVRHITSLFTGIKTSVEKFFGKGDDPKHPTKGSIPALVANLKAVFENFFNVEKPGAKKLLDGFKTFFRFASKLAVQGIGYVAKSLAEGMKSIALMIQGKAPIPGAGAVGGAAAGGFGFLKEVLVPIFNALKDAGKIMWPAIVELVKSIGQRIAKAFNDHKAEIASFTRPALAGLAALLFGPAFSRALLGALTTALAKAAIGGITKGMGALINRAVKTEETAKKVTGAASAPGMKQVTAVTEEAGKATKAGKGWGVKDAVALGLKLIAIATALAVGGVMMAGSFVAMKKILDAGGIKETKDLIPSMEVLASMVLAAIPISIALRVASKVGNIGDVATGGLVVAAAVAIVGVVGAGLAWMLSKVASPTEIEAAGNLMLKMSLVFLAMIPLIAAATALGTLVGGPQAVVLAATAAGFGVITTAVGAMSAVAVGIVEQLSKLDIGPGFQRKIDAFLGIMRAVQAFADTLVKVIELMEPSFTELITGATESFTEKVNSARKLISDMVGTKGGGKGIVGVVETVLAAIKDLEYGPGMAEKAQIFAEVLTAISEVMKSMTPSDAFFVAGDSFMSHLAGPKPFSDLAADVQYYMNKMRDSVKDMITGKGGVIEIINDLKDIKFTKEEAEQAKVASTLIQAITSVMHALTPDGDTLKGFSDSAEGAIFAWGSFKLGATKVSKLNTKAMADAFTAIGNQMQTLLPALTTGVLKTVMDQMQGKSAADLEGLKTAAEIMKTSIDAGKMIADTFKPGSAPVGIDQNAINQMTSSLPIAFKAVAKVQENIGKIDTGKLRGFGQNMDELAKTLHGDEKGAGGVVGALMAINEMVGISNQLDESLSKLNQNIDVKAKLGQLATAVGLGGKVNYTVNPSRNVQLNINLQVTMDVGEVEKVMILRKQSIIADRLDFATIRAPGSKISGPELTTMTPASPPASPATRSPT